MNVKQIIAALCAAFFFISSGFAARAYEGDVQQVLADCADYLCQAVPNPTIGSVGGEWAILGLARSGVEVPQDYFARYYQNVCSEVQAAQGVLHDRKYTEYARVVLALTAIGKDPQNVCGYNLLMPLADYDKTVWQGLNGPIFALIALNSKDYAIPQNPEAATQATKEMYVDAILRAQLEDGGFSLTGQAPSEVDITAMALCALADYRSDERVAAAIEKGLLCLSQMQEDSGGYAGFSQENSESTAQTMVALCTLGISLEDERFVKNGNTLLDHILSYYQGDGVFRHTDTEDLMATEQAMYALAACARAERGQTALYDMRDVSAQPDDPNDNAWGLAGKHADLSYKPVVDTSKTFSDIAAHQNEEAILALAQRNIINGRSETLFVPDDTMTRAEFAAIVVRALGVPSAGEPIFADVAENSWYYAPVATAYRYGIIQGVSETAFDPEGTITREQAAVMVARAAALYGLDTAMDADAARNVLAGFFDYTTVSGWAVESVAFCYSTGILDDQELEILPQAYIKRGEIAQMLYNLMGVANAR